MSPRILIWNEYRHERENPVVDKVYPDGIHGAIRDGLAVHGLEAGTATLDEPEHGLSEDVLAATDVLIWWGHKAHHDVEDHIVDRVQQRVLEGMGLIVLHSGHFSKIFKRLMGTSCDLKWREADESERIWVVNPSHPVAAELPEQFGFEAEEMYGEHFDIPAPDDLVFVSWFKGGEVFRSGCGFYRARGRIFYFRPGHETYPTYFDANVRQVIANAVQWAAPVKSAVPVRGNHKPLEAL